MKTEKLIHQKIKSKRGVTLVELLIGMTIIVIVFAGTLAAMSTGYTTTVYNADQDKASVVSASTNELVAAAATKMQFTKKAELDADLGSASSYIKTSTARYVKMTYVEPSSFFSSDLDERFSIFPDVESSVSGGSLIGEDAKVKGMIVRSACKSAQGTIYTETFVPYAKAT